MIGSWWRRPWVGGRVGYRIALLIGPRFLRVIKSLGQVLCISCWRRVVPSATIAIFSIVISKFDCPRAKMHFSFLDENSIFGVIRSPLSFWASEKRGRYHLPTIIYMLFRFLVDWWWKRKGVMPIFFCLSREEVLCVRSSIWLWCWEVNCWCGIDSPILPMLEVHECCRLICRLSSLNFNCNPLLISLSYVRNHGLILHIVWGSLLFIFKFKPPTTP